MDGIAERLEDIPLEHIEHQITQHAANLSAGTCRWLEMVGEFDRRRGWASWGCRSTGHWVSWRCAMAPVTAREHVRIARRLRDLPLVRETFARGELSYSQVRAITRVATPADERTLVKIARCSTAAQLERVVRGYRTAAGVDLEAAQRVHARRFLHWSWEDDGSLSIRGSLSPEDGALFIETVRRAALADAPAVAPAVAAAGAPAALPAAETEGASAEAPTAPPVARRAAGADRRAELLAAQLVAAVGGRRDPDAAADAEHPIHCGRGARAADALVRLLRAGSSGAGRPGSRAAPAEVVVHVDVETLREDLIQDRCEIDDGPAVAPETARRMTCDGAVVLMVEGDGRPLDVGRRTRVVPAAIRRALESRDGGCRFPGCDHRHELHAHHVLHWARGGSTERDNLVLLCRFHHWLVHEGGFSTAGRGDDVVFLRPDGRPIEPLPDVAGGRAEDVAEANARAGLRIDERTCVPRWFGERLDLHYVVARLCEVAERAA